MVSMFWKTTRTQGKGLRAPRITVKRSLCWIYVHTQAFTQSLGGTLIKYKLLTNMLPASPADEKQQSMKEMWMNH